MGRFDADPPKPPTVRRRTLGDGREVAVTTYHGHLLANGRRVARCTQKVATIDGQSAAVALAESLLSICADEPAPR